MKGLIKKNEDSKSRNLRISSEVIDIVNKALYKVSRNYHMSSLIKDMIDDKGNLKLRLVNSQWSELFDILHKNDQIRMTCVNGTYIIKPI